MITTLDALLEETLITWLKQFGPMELWWYNTGQYTVKPKVPRRLHHHSSYFRICFCGMRGWWDTRMVYTNKNGVTDESFSKWW